jgi:phosphoserine phosphatase RsbU/P
MGRERLPDAYPEPFLRPVRSDSGPRPSFRTLLLGTWAGRLFLGAAGTKLLVLFWRVSGALPGVMQVVGAVATIALLVSLTYFAWRLFVLIKRRLLWRVRRKLILSYIFIGVIPSLLILIFFLFAGILVFSNVSAYLFKDGYEQVVDDAKLGA